MTGCRNNHFHVLMKRFGYNVHYDFFGGSNCGYGFRYGFGYDRKIHLYFLWF